MEVVGLGEHEFGVLEDSIEVVVLLIRIELTFCSQGIHPAEAVLDLRLQLSLGSML